MGLSDAEKARAEAEVKGIMKRFDESVRARVMGEGLCIRGWWWGLLCCEEVRGIMNRFDESVRACCVCFFFVLCCGMGDGRGFVVGLCTDGR